MAACLVAQTSLASAQPVVCRAPLKPMLRAELFFGRNVAGRLRVGERQWARFVEREISPRFPDGLTVIDARGRWRDAARKIIREPSKVVVVVTADTDDTRKRIDAVVSAYKQRFGQKSVGIVTAPVCAAF